MNKLKYQLASPVLMWAVVFVGAVILYFAVPRHSLFFGGKIGDVVLALGLLNWIWVTIQATKIHKQAQSSVQNIDQLVTEGAYGVIRHPMYLADIILAWSFFVYHGSYKVLFAVFWITLVLVFWANFEERMLEEKFLDDYRAYKQRVPMFIPYKKSK